jgi:predicted peptidase
MDGQAWLAGSAGPEGGKIGFRVRPAPASAGSRPPAILFLHGRGESGTDNQRQIEVGLPRFVDADPDAWPFLIIAPQKPALDRLWPEFQPGLAAMLAEVDARWPSDPSRRYLTGLSQGGNGTLELARALPWTFAAVAPVCGWANPMRAGWELSRIPTWLFHGSDDRVVPASCSMAVQDCLHKNGLERRLSLYPGVDHNSWDQAYGPSGDGPALARWLLSHAGEPQA